MTLIILVSNKTIRFYYKFLHIHEYCCDYIKNKSADRIFVFLSADKHHFDGRLKLLISPNTFIGHKALQSADDRPILDRLPLSLAMIGRLSADTSADEKVLIQI